MYMSMSNSAPEKIYLQVCGDCNDNDCENCKFDDFEDNITWCKDRIFPKDIEYTRTDAFVVKVEKYLQEHLIDYWSQSVTDESKFIEDLKNYMKGE